MTNEVDQLSLKIDIKATNEDATTIKNIASAIRSLNNAVKNTANISNYVNELSRMAKTLRSLSRVRPMQSATKLKTEKVTRATDLSGLQGVDMSQPSNYGQLKKVRNETRGLSKDQEKATKSTLKFNLGIKTLFKSLGRIAFYRAIRTAIKEVVQTFTEGLANLRAENKQLDKSMKQIQTGVTGIKNAVASLLVPFINALAPTITRIGDELANYVNKLEEARAALKGETTYTKILTSDTEEYRKQLEAVNGELAEYDKFSSLNKQKTYTGTTTADVTMNVEEAKQYQDILKSIDDNARNFADFIYGLFDNIRIFFERNGTALRNLFSALLSIANFLNTIIIPILNFIMGIVQAIVGVFQWLIGSIKVIFGGGLDTFSKGIYNMGYGIANAFGGNYGWFADGGTFSRGTKFIAGEAGAEAVYNTSGGNGGVVNIEQFTSAMYNALVAYGAAKDRPNGGNVYLDSTRVGQLVEKSVYNEGVRVGHFGK